MEKLSPTQGKSNNVEDIKKSIKENLNYIYIILMFLLNMILSVVNIVDGDFALVYPKTALGWILWITRIVIGVAIGVMILNSFRAQGIKNGKKAIKEVHDKYIKLSSKDTKNKKPRSELEYQAQYVKQDSIKKAAMHTLTGLFMTSIILGASPENLLGLIANTVLAVGFGIKALLEAEEYVTTELVVWYAIEIDKIEKATAEANKPQIKLLEYNNNGTQ